MLQAFSKNMRFPLAASTVRNHVLGRLFKQAVVRDLNRWCDAKRGHALIYHKTDSLVPGYAV